MPVINSISTYLTKTVAQVYLKYILMFCFGFIYGNCSRLGKTKNFREFSVESSITKYLIISLILFR